MNKEFKVGLLLVIAGTILYFGFNFLKGRDFFSSSKKFYVQYSDIDGLTVSNPVILNGFAIGRVDEIKILHDKQDSLLVLFSVQGDLEVNDQTIAELVSSDILGGKALNLHLNKGKIVLESGAYVKSRQEESIASIIERTAVPVISNVDTLVDDLKKYMRGENEKNITNTIANLSKSMSQIHEATIRLNLILAENKTNFNTLSSNLILVSEDLSKTMKKIEPIMKNMSGFSDSLAALEMNKTLNAATASLNSVTQLMQDINQENGTVGKLLNSPQMHQDLTATIRDVDYLVTDMQANPKRYIQFSVVGGTPKDEKALIKSFNEKNISNQLIIDLKRDAPMFLLVKLYRKDRSVVELVPKGLGTKTIVIDLPADFTAGSYLAKLDWDISSEAFSFEVK